MNRLLITLLSVVCALLPLRSMGEEIALAAGDQISLQISGVQPDEAVSISHAYRISEKGTISLLYLNEVQAAGLKPSELEKRIASLYISKELFTHPTVNVNIDTDSNPRFVSVGGAVNKPGPVNYRAGLTLGAAIDSAAPSAFARLKQVQLVREGKDLGPLDVSKAASPAAATVLKPGDRIVVPDR